MTSYSFMSTTLTFLCFLQHSLKAFIFKFGANSYEVLIYRVVSISLNISDYDVVQIYSTAVNS